MRDMEPLMRILASCNLIGRQSLVLISNDAQAIQVP